MKCPLIIDLLHPVKLKPEPKPTNNITIGNCADLYTFAYLHDVEYSDKKVVEFNKAICPTTVRFFTNWNRNNDILIQYIGINILKGGILLTPRIMRNSYWRLNIGRCPTISFKTTKITRNTGFLNLHFVVDKVDYFDIAIATEKVLKGTAMIEVILKGKERR